MVQQVMRMACFVGVAAVFASFSVSGATAIAQAPPDFSGKWKLDQADSSSVGGGNGSRRGGGAGQGGGLGLGPSANELTIKQTPASMTIDEHWGAGSSSRRVYELDGKKKSNQVGAGRGVAATTVSMWVDRQLVTTIAVAAQGGSREYKETRYLDDNGRLIVETTVAVAPNSRKAVYVREK